MSFATHSRSVRFDQSTLGFESRIVQHNACLERASLRHELRVHVVHRALENPAWQGREPHLGRLAVGDPGRLGFSDLCGHPDGGKVHQIEEIHAGAHLRAFPYPELGHDAVDGRIERHSPLGVAVLFDLRDLRVAHAEK